jgi:putative FmdB family regulatory protein
MPTYDYICDECGEKWEMFQSMKDEPIKECICEKKSKNIRRLIGPGAGLIFKGSGFYVTDYKNNGNNGSKSADTNSNNDSCTKEKSAEKPACESCSCSAKNTANE